MKLRDYQQAAIDAVFQFWLEREGLNPLLVLPTGAGKTVIFAFMLSRLLEVAPGARVLFLAHRKELLGQAEDKIRSVLPGVEVSVYSAAMKRKEFGPLTVASRDSLRTVKNLPAFDLVVIDEAHNVSPKEESGYRSLIFKLKLRKPSLCVTGLTATPFRMTDGLIYGPGADTLFDSVAYEIKIKTLIDAGHLVPVVAKPVESASIPDLSQVRSSGGDFSLKDLELVSADVEVVRSAVADWHFTAIIQQKRKLTLFFCVSLAHAELVAAELARAGFVCPIISGDTPAAERDRLMKQARNLELDGLVNVGVLTEGTDIPAIDCVAMLRPTKSLGLWLQMVGRGMRLSPDTGKTDCLLLDFGDCLGRFGPIDAAQPPEKGGNSESRVKPCPKCNELVSKYARKCKACGEQFEPEPCRICPQCREENAPTASKCVACGYVFVTHEEAARSGAALSAQAAAVKFEVSDVFAKVVQDKRQGRPFIQVAFCSPCGLHVGFSSIYWGFPGLAGATALRNGGILVGFKDACPGDPEAMAALINRNARNRIGAATYFPLSQDRAVQSVSIKTGEAA